MEPPLIFFGLLWENRRQSFQAWSQRFQVTNFFFSFFKTFFLVFLLVGSEQRCCLALFMMRSSQCLFDWSRVHMGLLFVLFFVAFLLLFLDLFINLLLRNENACGAVFGWEICFWSSCFIKVKKIVLYFILYVCCVLLLSIWVVYFWVLFCSLLLLC